MKKKPSAKQTGNKGGKKPVGAIDQQRRIPGIRDLNYSENLPAPKDNQEDKQDKQPEKTIADLKKERFIQLLEKDE